MPPIYAHSKNEKGHRHLLSHHLRSVALLARDMAEPFGGGDLCFLAGLWHDVGKADPEWQRLLLECEGGDRKRVGLDHKCAGALLAEELGGMADLAGLLIQGHHGGLRNLQNFKGWLAEKRRHPGPKKAIDLLAGEMRDIRAVKVPAQPEFVTCRRSAELFLRFCFSALVDADSLDTEAHKLGGDAPNRGSGVTLGELWGRYQAFVSNQPEVPDTPVNRVRREVHDACLTMATEPPGIYRLTVPTGGGKTRSAMAFALRHGITHGLRRVVVAVPFTTVTEQTANVYRQMFERGHPDLGRVVLEHHSSAWEGERADLEGDGFAPGRVWQRLASENWEAPIVVTTTVQLFESLFSNSRSKARKLHNLAGSVVIVDEAQSLPPGLLTPILDVINQLADNYKITFVLSTATQPSFEQIEPFRKARLREIVAAAPRHFEALRRVEYEWRADRRYAWSEVAEWARDERSVLVVVNTKRHALELLEEMDDPGALHLSSLLCSAHRASVVETIRRRLAEGISCRVVATQVVEAGVDLDFPAVYRAEAPLDSIIQAAGRCNREGLLGRPGKVVVFKPPDNAVPPGVYRSGRDVTDLIRQLPGFDPNDPKSVEDYFRWMVETVIDPDQHKIQRARENLDFEEVAERFRMITDDTYDVVVPYAEAPSEWVVTTIEQLRNGLGRPRELMRQIGPYTVSIRGHEAERLKAGGWVSPIRPGLGKWNGTYDSVWGITETDPDLIL